MSLLKLWENPMLSLDDRLEAAISEIERVTDGWREAFNGAIAHQERAKKLEEENIRLSTDRGAMLDAIEQLPNDVKGDPAMETLLAIASRMDVTPNEQGQRQDAAGGLSD